MHLADMGRLYQAGRSGFSLVRVMMGGGRVPLFISWNVTFRCNLHCAYCGAADAPRRECTTEEIISGLKSLRPLGARWVTFGGGEPLLRADMGELIGRAKELGYNVFLSTNGRFVPERMDILKRLDNINISLDGPRDVHDAVRGAEAYDHALAAVAAIRQAGLPFSFQCVLAGHNLECVEETLAIAREQQGGLMFQPATQWLDSSTAPNPIAPPIEPYRAAIARIQALKRAGAPVANSQAGLRHLACWPEPTPIKCLAARLMVAVEPDGTLLSCHQCDVDQFLAASDAPKEDLAEQFATVKAPKGCAQCWCAPVVELALICSLKPEPIWNTVKRFFL